MTSLHEFGDLICLGLQLLAVQCTLLLLELGLLAGCAAFIVIWKGKPAHRPRALRCERKSRLMQKRQGISCFLVYLTLWSGVEGAAQQCAAEGVSPHGASWDDFFHGTSTSTLKCVSAKLDSWIIPDASSIGFDETFFYADSWNLG